MLVTGFKICSCLSLTILSEIPSIPVAVFISNLLIHLLINLLSTGWKENDSPLLTLVFVVLTDFNNTRMFAIYINTIFSNIVCNIDKKVVKGITNLSFWFIEGASSVGITGTNCQCCCSCCVMICGRLVHLGIKYRRRLSVAPGSRVFIYPLFKSL